jgi:hypothetical protein
MLIAVTAWAAPIAGGFQTDFVIHSSTCGIDQDGDTFVDEDSDGGGDNDGDTLVDEDPCYKVGDTIMKFEADLFLQMTISGLEIGSTTVFTFEGLEFQAISIAATIGALSVKDTFIFAPSVIEVEYVRTPMTLALRYCINASAPGSVTPPFMSCPLPDNMLYWLLEDVGHFHPADANYRLATIFDNAGTLTNTVVFRKKIVDLSLNIAGITLSSRALFANLGTATTPSFSVGVIVSAEGQTVSGVSVRAESWIGARQGLECFAECKPAEIYRVGKVLSPNNLTIQEEKIFIRNLTIAGVTFNIRAEFQFYTQPGSTCPNPGICYVQIDSRGIVQPLNLTVLNQLRLGPNLNPHYDILQTSMKFGDINVTALWHFYMGLVGHWDAQLAQFISTFDPPGLTVTSDIVLCTESLFVGMCGLTNGAVQHNIYLSTTIGNFVFDLRIYLYGLLGPFNQLWTDLKWRAGNVELTSSMVMSTDALEVLAFRIVVRF